MGGAASMLTKKEKADGEEEQGSVPDGGAERENEEANTKPRSRFQAGFVSLKNRATTVANKALAKVGLVDDEEDVPGGDEEDDPPQNHGTVTRTGSEPERTVSEVIASVITSGLASVASSNPGLFSACTCILLHHRFSDA